MREIMKSLITLIGITLLGIGMASATPSSSDCGDDDVQPISVQSAAKAINKDT